MDKVLERALSTAKHLLIVDQFFATHDQDYMMMRKKIDSLEGYEKFSKELYVGKDGRQMILYDYLMYILVSRGSIWGFHKTNRKSYLKMILYVVNQLLIQEQVTTYACFSIRKRLMDFMKKQNIPYFFEDEEAEKIYEEAKKFKEDLSYKDKKTKKLYYAVDSLLPKSVGAAIELIVYAYLIRHNFGYVIPMLLNQRLLSHDSHSIAPDFLIVKNGRIFGVEVKQAIQKTPDHIFDFSSRTSIPVVVARVPNTVPLRCPICEKWILYCDEIINRFSDYSQKIEDIKISCKKECKNFRKCNYITYKGVLKPSEEKELHYHYNCVRKKPFVRNLLKDEKEQEKRLISYYPHVQGLSRL
ncbi:MAG: hypothetical protein QXL57_04930 [Candidatus Bathyarchaeia archaeon]